VTLGEENSGNCGMAGTPGCFANTSSVSFISSGGPFYNIRVQRSGNSWTTNGVVPVNDVKIYAFSGDQYVEQSSVAPDENTDTTQVFTATSVGSAGSGSQDKTNSEIAGTVTNWARAMESNDPSQIANCYASQVDRYFLRLNVTNSFIRDYMQSWIVDGNRHVTKFTPVDLVIDSQTESSVTMHLTKHVITIDARGSSERFTRSQLFMIRDVGDWKITSERDFK
jgi:hypothetical protein